jgi:transposase
MARTMLTDELWSKLSTLLRLVGIYGKKGLRMTIEGILYRLRVGCPWWDLPSCFGYWNNVYRRFNEWSKKGKITKLFELAVQDPDLEWIFVDGSIVKAHQHSSGCRKHEKSEIGYSVAGNSSKIHLAVDSFGLPVAFRITEGQVHDSKIAPEFFASLPQSDFKIADKGYDDEVLRAQVKNNNETPIIPRRKNSKTGNNDIDWTLYKYRHLVENAFARLKHFRAIATRFDKLARNYSATVAFACTFLWLPMWKW